MRGTKREGGFELKTNREKMLDLKYAKVLLEMITNIPLNKLLFHNEISKEMFPHIVVTEDKRGRF